LYHIVFIGQQVIADSEISLMNKPFLAGMINETAEHVSATGLKKRSSLQFQ